MKKDPKIEKNRKMLQMSGKTSRLMLLSHNVLIQLTKEAARG